MSKYLRTNNSKDLEVNDQLSIALWFFINQNNIANIKDGLGGMACKYNPNNNGYCLSMSSQKNGALHFAVANNGSVYTVTTVDNNYVNMWHHVVATYDSTAAATIYVDNQK